MAFLIESYFSVKKFPKFLEDAKEPLLIRFFICMYGIFVYVNRNVRMKGTRDFALIELFLQKIISIEYLIIFNT